MDARMAAYEELWARIYLEDAVFARGGGEFRDPPDAGEDDDPVFVPFNESAGRMLWIAQEMATDSDGVLFEFPIITRCCPRDKVEAMLRTSLPDHVRDAINATPDGHFPCLQTTRHYDCASGIVGPLAYEMLYHPIPLHDTDYRGEAAAAAAAIFAEDRLAAAIRLHEIMDTTIASPDGFPMIDWPRFIEVAAGRGWAMIEGEMGHSRDRGAFHARGVRVERGQLTYLLPLWQICHNGRTSRRLTVCVTHMDRPLPCHRVGLVGRILRAMVVNYVASAPIAYQFGEQVRLRQSHHFRMDAEPSGQFGGKCESELNGSCGLLGFRLAGCTRSRHDDSP